MKAVVYHGLGDVRLDDVPEPKIEQPSDAIVRTTASAICGTDLHFVRGSFPGMEAGQIIGHEAVGIVEEAGKDCRNLRPGDRVVVGSTIGCGTCSYCRASYYSKCDNANPVNPQNTAFFGGPKEAGGIRGLQAEYARIPFASVGAVKLPDGVSDDDAIVLSDIFPTAYFAADMASIKPGHLVVVLGCGPVGQLAIASAKLFDAGRIIAVDCVESRLQMAAAQGAETVNFQNEDPVEAIRSLTRGIGADCAIDAVGIDAYGTDGPPKDGFEKGNKPSQALEWAVEIVAKAGHISLIGVYPPTLTTFPIGKAFGKNLTIRMGDCPHRRYLPKLVRLTADGTISPSKLITQQQGMADAISAYRSISNHEPGWLKVELLPGQSGTGNGTMHAEQLVTA
jgi:threonine dehydrogenase-like Zn-dependent dehydrogenase